MHFSNMTTLWMTERKTQDVCYWLICWQTTDDVVVMCFLENEGP